MPNPMFGPFLTGVGANFAESDWRDMFSFVFLDGVAANALSALAVSAGSGMQVNVSSGQAGVRGQHFRVTTTTSLAIATADPTNPRIDLVVVHANHTSSADAICAAKTIALGVKTGTPAGSPSAPTVTQTEGTAWEIPLAQVLVPAGATSIVSGDLTDVRVFQRKLIANVVAGTGTTSGVAHGLGVQPLIVCLMPNGPTPIYYSINNIGPTTFDVHCSSAEIWNAIAIALA